MKQFSYDVAVALRVYPKVSRYTPPVFPEDKFKLVEFCLNSFKNSIGGLRIKLWVILNSCPPEYESLFTSRFQPEDLTVVRLQGAGAGTTLYEQTRILLEQTDAEIVYFAEDDYFYLPGQFASGVKFLSQNADADFICVFESSDFYTADLHNMAFEKREFDGKIWSSCISGTHTFIAKRSSLIECQDVIHRLFRACKGNTIPDLAMWAALTKKRVFNPIKFIKWSLTHRWFWAGSIALSWYHCWRQILFGRTYKLWSPHPCLANHMIAGLEAPGVDWQKAFEQQLRSS